MLSEAGEGNCVFVLVKAHQNEGVVNQIDSRGVNAPPLRSMASTVSRKLKRKSEAFYSKMEDGERASEATKRKRKDPTLHVSVHDWLESIVYEQSVHIVSSPVLGWCWW